MDFQFGTGLNVADEVGAELPFSSESASFSASSVAPSRLCNELCSASCLCENKPRVMLRDGILGCKCFTEDDQCVIWLHFRAPKGKILSCIEWVLAKGKEKWDAIYKI
jgi:hypothetical protein